MPGQRRRDKPWKRRRLETDRLPVRGWLANPWVLAQFREGERRPWRTGDGGGGATLPRTAKDHLEGGWHALQFPIPRRRRDDPRHDQDPGRIPRVQLPNERVGGDRSC